MAAEFGLKTMLMEKVQLLHLHSQSKNRPKKGSDHHRGIIALDERLRLTASPSESREWWLSVDWVVVEQAFHRQLTGLGKLAEVVGSNPTRSTFTILEITALN